MYILTRTHKDPRTDTQTIGRIRILGRIHIQGRIRIQGRIINIQGQRK